MIKPQQIRTTKKWEGTNNQCQKLKNKYHCVSQKTVTEYFEKSYAYKFETLDEIFKFLENHSYCVVIQGEILSILKVEYVNKTSIKENSRLKWNHQFYLKKKYNFK